MKFNSCSIGDLVTYNSRGITPKYSDDKNKLIVINQKCIRDGVVNLEVSRNHDETLRSVPTDKIVQKFDVLVNSTGVGTLGRVAQYHYMTIATVDTHVTILRPDVSKIDPLLFGYLVRKAQPEIEGLAEGSTGQVELKRGLLADINVIYPVDIQEQKSRAKILSDIESKIANNKRINKILEEIAQALFKSWFVDFEPVKAKIQANTEGKDLQLAAMWAISGKTEQELHRLPLEKRKELAITADLFPDEFEESEMGMIPKGWKVIPLYETAEYINGAAFKAKDFSPNNDGLPIIKIAELKAGITAQTKYTNRNVSEKYRINNDSMLYSWSGSPETSLEVFKWFGGEGWLNQHIFKINAQRLEQKVFVYFLFKHLKRRLIEIAKNKQTTGLGHVTVADMKRIDIVIPSDDSLTVIIKILVILFEKASNCLLQNTILTKQRDTLLPKLSDDALIINDIK